jgi:DNA primase
MDVFPSHNVIFEQYAGLTQDLGNLNEFYKHSLRDEPMEYLTGQRRLTYEQLKMFRIGYGPSTELVQSFLRINHIDPADIRKAGVAVEKFEDRIIFPIYDIAGAIVGFSGRTWQEGDVRPKYYNSLSSPVFKKSLALYGLYQAKESIKRDNFAIVVEGNIDVVQLHGGGLTHAVAPCGTALTKNQMFLLTRLTDRILFCFDSDSAGKSATEKVKKMCQEFGLEFLPFGVTEAKDPDEFIRSYGIKPIIDIVIGVLSEHKGKRNG